MARANKKNIQRRNRFEIAAALLVLVVIAGLYLHHATIPVLQPAGPVAAGERHLLIIAFLLMLIVVIPVFALTFGFVWRYRESNHKATYKPNWDHSRVAETIWWLVPGALIITLSVLTWHGTYRYDPYKPLASSHKPITVEVVALDWRWLFIYPEQHVASINQLYMPVGTPVNFQITADAPMNSFWLPQLGGQMYAMPGMNTQLNLMADRSGTFTGRSANVSGKGFAGMQFTALAGSQAGFSDWLATAKKGAPLTTASYAHLATASSDSRVHYFQATDNALYGSIVNKYMSMGSQMTSSSAMPSSNMNMEMN